MSNVLELLPGDSQAIYLNRSEKAENGEVPRVTEAELSYNEFFWKYMESNQPLIITSTAVDWKCTKEWVKDGRVNMNFLESIADNKNVPVANCSKTYYNSHEKSEIPFKQYQNYWEKRTDSSELLYLKDWHLKASKSDYNFYTVPKYFASDWLNEYLIDTKKDDYRFVYIGPQGSWTPFHSDVFSSFSWSANIFGIKKWLLLEPGEECKLKDKLGNDPFSIDDTLLKENDVNYFTILQRANEAIFVPSKWYHQVWNVTDTISVNHNWFNGCNVHLIWNSMRQTLENVVKEISDCRDMDDFEQHCQLMCKSVFGMDFNDFVDVLEHVAMKRMRNDVNMVFDEYEFNEFHKQFDLEQVYQVLNEMQSYEIVNENIRLNDRCTDILGSIDGFRIK